MQKKLISSILHRPNYKDQVWFTYKYQGYFYYECLFFLAFFKNATHVLPTCCFKLNSVDCYFLYTKPCTSMYIMLMCVVYWILKIQYKYKKMFYMYML
jgi:hypothetical protein